MPGENHVYKTHIIVPKPTDSKELEEREELSKRLNGLGTEDLKKTLEGIQAKEEQEVKERREQEEKASFIGILDLMTSGESLGKFSDGRFIFNEGVEKDDGDGKYIEIIEKRYYEWSEGMNGFGYRCVLRRTGYYCLFCGEFKDGHILRGIQIFDDGEKYVGQFRNDEREGQGIYTWPDGAKYVGQWKNDASEGQGTFTWANGDKYVGQFKNDVKEGQGTFFWTNGNILTGIWKNDYIPEGKIKLKSDGTEIDVTWDEDKSLWKVTTKGEYKDKYIDDITGEFVEP